MDGLIEKNIYLCGACVPVFCDSPSPDSQTVKGQKSNSVPSLVLLQEVSGSSFNTGPTRLITVKYFHAAASAASR